MDHNSDFLGQIPTGFETKEPRRRGWFVGWSLVLLVLFFVLWTTANAGLAAISLLDGRDQLVEAETRLGIFAFDQAKESLNKADEDLSNAYWHLRMVGWLKIIPWLGPQLSVTEELLEISSGVLEIVDQVADLGSDVVGLINESQQVVEENFWPRRFDDLSPQTKKVFLQRLNGLAPDLALAAKKAELINKELSGLAEVDEPVGGIVRKLNNSLDQASRILSLAATASRLIPAFTGLDQERTYLLLLENNAELRPAGGFIGTYGVLKIENGEIKELSVKDSYLLDLAAEPYCSVEPPFPLKQYLAADKWYFRDSNWSPDFPTASRQAIAMFTNEVLSIPPEIRIKVQEPLSFDGVIAFTPTFISDLLLAIGPVSVGDQTFSAENILDALEYQVEKGFAEDGIPYTQRKEIVTSLLNEIKAKIFNLSLVEWAPLVDVFQENLSRKQLVLFNNSSVETENTIINAGWGGVVNSGDQDFLMVVDANLASLKTDPKVKRTIVYSIDKNIEGQMIGRVEIKYDHIGSFDWKTTRYRTYTRVYVPKGSRLISSSGLSLGEVVVEQDLEAMVFGGFISVEPGQSGALNFVYLLPEKIQAAIADGDYSLLVNKQIGAATHALTLNLNFDKKVSSASPAEVSTEWGDGVYRLETDLSEDKKFEVWF